MAMNTWSRMGAATGDKKYFTKQWANFEAAMLKPANGKTTFGFWNTTDHLFYRDDRFVHTQIYWGRGNGWAMGGAFHPQAQGIAYPSQTSLAGCSA
jgi:rhamnogalacturonyl hydrolase YesR